MTQQWTRLHRQFAGLWPLWLAYNQDGQLKARLLEKGQYDSKKKKT